MPNGGGKEAFLGMRRIDPDVKAILCSGYARNGQAQEILYLGVRDFLQKPFTVEALSAALRRLIG